MYDIGVRDRGLYDIDMGGHTPSVGRVLIPIAALGLFVAFSLARRTPPLDRERAFSPTRAARDVFETPDFE